MDAGALKEEWAVLAGRNEYDSLMASMLILGG